MTALAPQSAPADPAARPLVLGEALIDVVHQAGQTAEHVGGSPLNVACVLAGMGHRPRLGAWWAVDERGDRIAEYLRAHGVEAIAGSDGAERTSTAQAEVDDQAQARYTFDLAWQLPELPEVPVSHLHTGSIAATLEPGGSAVLAAVRALREQATISYDPNARPAIMGSPEAVRQRIAELVAESDLVKASDEDLAWLHPGVDVVEVLRGWTANGPRLAVATLGGNGAVAVLAGTPDPIRVAPLAVEVVDTVGAGDSFMGGLISGLLDAGLLGGPEARERLRTATQEQVVPALLRAAITSGLTVAQAGAHAPSRGEVTALE